MAYQPGLTDQFYHVYEYDAENRITDVLTSYDSLVWEKDARYSYYKHGPLARTILGQQQVQGIDYAYTLQGWLKGVNSSNVSKIGDIGQDGYATGITVNQVAADVYGFNLNYFNNDYKSVSGITPFAAQPVLTASDVQTGNELFNGNIRSMAVNIPRLGTAQLYGYQYDQLNRITAMDAFTGLKVSTNAWEALTTTAKYRERITYDANGNILTYKRNGNKSSQQTMDDLGYHYNYYTSGVYAGKLMNNKLNYVTDAVTNTAAYSASDPATGVDDLETQAAGNYEYDAIGNLVKDTKEGISNITWSVYGKILSIQKAAGTITYTYDASGNRITKTYNGKTTWYVRDASGNVMSIYETDPAINSGHLTQTEAHLYGSSRLGVFNVNRDISSITKADYTVSINTFARGNKFFELSNHLGNVLVTISDRKAMQLPANDGCTPGSGKPIRNIDYHTDEDEIVATQGINLLPGFETWDNETKFIYINPTLGICPPTVPEEPPVGSYYRADVITANDYYPGGMMMPGRKYQAGSGYRYGFNGKENDKDAGEGIQDYGLRIYDGRLGRFLSVDPLSNQFAWNSVYCYAEGDPVNYIDLDGGEKPPLKAQVVPIAKRPIIEPVHSEAPPLALQQARQRAMSIGPILNPEQKKAADQAAIIKQLQSNQTTIQQGGYSGSFEGKIAKGRYDLYGKYLPGVSDIDDGLTFIGNIKDGNYKAAAFTALFFLPGGDFLKPLKSLKGAGKLGGTACMDYAKSFMGKYGKKIEEAGGTVKKMEIDMGGGFIGAGIGAESKQLSNTGLHQFIEVTDKSGVAKIFDNAHPDGILKSDYLKSILGSNAKNGVMDGANLYEKYAKEAVKK